MKHLEAYNRDDIGGSTLLRTLTRKSVLGFGKYGDITIDNIINLKHTQYLRWVYYNYSKISFTNDVLNDIEIPEKYRIDKPGKDLELHQKLNVELNKRLNKWAKFKRNSYEKGVKKIQSKQRLSQDSGNFRKGILQAKNQGRM